MAKYSDVASGVRADLADAGGTITFPGAFAGTDSPDVTGVALQLEDDPVVYEKLGLIFSNPVTVMIAASELEIIPVPGMLFRWGSTLYTAKHVEPLDPAGDGPIYYTVVGIGG